MKIDQETKNLAKKIWNYHKMNHILEKADCILVLCSSDIRGAKRGADLFLQGWSPRIMFSGGFGYLTKDIWHEPEADKFAKIAVDLGVPKNKILIENKSSNTGENIKFSYQLLDKNNIHPRKLILVQKPYMERRTYATFMKQWPDKKTKIIVTSPPISFEEYPNKEIPLEKVLNIMVGDLQRIKIYPKKGFQISQKIPNNVWSAFMKLVEKGYTKYLVE